MYFKLLAEAEATASQAQTAVADAKAELDRVSIEAINARSNTIEIETNSVNQTIIQRESTPIGIV